MRRASGQVPVAVVGRGEDRRVAVQRQPDDRRAGAAAGAEGAPDLGRVGSVDDQARVRRARAFVVADGSRVVGRGRGVDDQGDAVVPEQEREGVGVGVRGQRVRAGRPDIGDEVEAARPQHGETAVGEQP